MRTMRQCTNEDEWTQAAQTADRIRARLKLKRCRHISGGGYVCLIRRRGRRTASWLNSCLPMSLKSFS